MNFAGHIETTNKQKNFCYLLVLDMGLVSIRSQSALATQPTAHSTNSEKLKLFIFYSFGCSVNENQFPQPSLNKASIP